MELTRTFDFRGLSIQVHCNILAPLHWLEEFMSPALCSGEQIEIRKEIRLSVDEHRYAQILAATQSGPQRPIDTFTKDGSFEQFTAHSEPGGREILHFPPGECFIIPETGGTIELVARADQAMLRRCLMRLVRELAMIQAMHRGDVFLHGAAVVCRGQAILICGARRAGKTSMLINALRQKGMSFLSNDRLFIQRNENPCIVRGMPTIIAIRPDSFAHLPGLAPPQWGFEYRHYLTLRECEEKSSLMQPPYQDPPSMNPPQFCKWLGVETAVNAPLRAVIFPTVDQTADSFALQRQSSEQAESLLAANIFWSGDNGPIAEAFAPGWPAPAPSLQDLKNSCRDVARQCAVMTCQIGSAAFGSPNVWDAIVSAVFEDQ